MLRGNITVGVTKKTLDELEALEVPYSLSELMAAKCLMLQEGTLQINIFDERDKLVERYRNYFNDVARVFKAKTEACIRDAISQAFIRFRKNHPELQEIVSGLGKGAEYDRLNEALVTEVNEFIHNVLAFIGNNGLNDIQMFVLNSTLPIALANKLGMTLAGSILANTVAESNTVGEDDLVEKRKRLTKAVITTIVKRLIHG